MSTDIVQCDQCGKVVKTADAHGWFEVRTYVTRPTPEYVAQLPDAIRDQLPPELSPKKLPFKVGGDFCTIPCLIKFAQAHQTMGESFGDLPPYVEEREDESPNGDYEGDYYENEWYDDTGEDPQWY